VPLGRALLQANFVKNSTLKIIKGAPHGMCTTLKDQVNQELLAFFKEGSTEPQRAAQREAVGAGRR
jgi:non-heme chloroperoxidase